MSLDEINAQLPALRRRAENMARDHWGYVLMGTLLAIAMTVGVSMLVSAMIRRRRRTPFERALDYVEDLGERREEIARNLRKLVENKVDASGLADGLRDRIELIRREVDAVGKAVKGAVGK
jgi:hypothetical protein